MTEDKIMTEDQAARLLKVSRTTLWRWRRAAKIRFYRLGNKKIAYSLLHIQEFLASCEQVRESA